MNKSKNSPKNEIRERSRKKERPEDTGSFNNPLALLTGNRIKTVTGLALLAFSLFLLLAFVSYLTSWEADQSVVTTFNGEAVESALPDTAQNWMGLLGAWLAHVFIYKGFGIASFLFLPLIFGLGYRILFGTSILPLGRLAVLSVFGILLLSLICGFLFQWNYNFLGGAVGFHAQRWLSGMFGATGVALMLVFFILSFMVLGFNVHLKLPSFAREKAEDMLQTKKDVKTGHEAEADEEEDEADIGELAAQMELTVIEDKKPVRSVTPPVTKTQTSPNGVSFTIKQPEPEPAKPKLSAEVVKEESETVNTESWYKYPPLQLLKDHEKNNTMVSHAELEESKDLIEKTLLDYKIGIRSIEATIGPTVTLYEIVPDAGIRISKIKNLEDDIALSLSALGIRIIAPIPGKGTIGIEVPNRNPQVVSLQQALASDAFRQSKADLPIALGKTISNEVFVADLAKMPHLLMAGATGQGKSVGINAILASILYKKHPEDVKFVLVDPKKVELSLYKLIEQHFLPQLPDGQEAIITDTKMVVDVLKSLCYEMDRRYDKLKDAQVRNIKEYNHKIERGQLDQSEHKRLPYIVLVIDELADLMMTAGKEVELPIARLAQLARAIGIHLIVATQRPSVNIITGVIKANFPARVAFRVTSKIDSRTILDTGGSEQLIGRGDMLFSTGNEIIRLQCPFIDTEEVERLGEHISTQPYPEPFRLNIITEEGDGFDGEMLDDLDSMFEDAARLVVATQQGSTSMLQRKLKLGYNRAGRLMDQLEKAKIVGEARGSNPREVLVSDESALEQYLTDLLSKY